VSRLRHWLRRSGSVAVPAVLCVAVLVTGACSTETPRERSSTALPPIESDINKLPPAVLPDLSQMDKVVQQQINDSYRAVTSSAAPRAYGDTGKLLMAAEYFEAAEPFYLRAQALEPGEMRWPYYLGHMYLAKAEPAKAIASFERALSIKPDDVATLVWLGGIHVDQGQPELAEPLYTKALMIQPRVVSALFGLGQVALAKREYARAVDQFEQALTADSRESIAHYPLALAYRGLGNTAQAEAHLRQQGRVEVGPPDPLLAELRGLLQGPVAEENRGIRAMDGGDFKAAAEHFRRGLELAPDSASLRHKLGTALSLMGDTSGAFDQFQETIRRFPDFAQAHYSLGVLLALNGRFPEAIDRFTAAVRYQPDYVEARLRLAELLRQTGRPDAALPQYERVMAIDPRAAEAQFGYAMALVQLKRYDEARRRLSEAAAAHPERKEFTEALVRLQTIAPGPRR
jgi:tetratricopeptide (TPR) repeat protein